MKKRKVRVDRIIILILTLILVLGILGFGVYKLFGLFFNDDKKENNTPTVVVTTDGVNVSLIDYRVYKDDTNDLGFNFIIAELGFKANEPISFEFKNLQTSEKIYLDDVSKYINKLDMEGYNVSKLELSNSGVSSSDNQTTAKVLIPFNTDADNLSVYNALNASKLEFDLTKNNYLVTSLKLSDSNTEIEVGTTKVSITNAYISDFMLHNNEPIELGSYTKIYSFEITVFEAEEGSKITDALFILKGSDDEIKCWGHEYQSIDMENLIDKELKAGTKGGLFFEVNSDENVVAEGTLLIKFSNEDKWIEVTNE